jgi:polyketide synthase PksN
VRGIGNREGRLYVPFALGHLEIIRPVTEVCYAHAVISPESLGSEVTKFNITILDERGEELVRIKDFRTAIQSKKHPSEEVGHRRPYQPVERNIAAE